MTGFARLWLPIHTSNEYGGWAGNCGPLYTRILHTNFQPRPGDTIYTTYDEEDDEDANDAIVEKVYWAIDGEYHIQLVGIHINPTDEIREGIRQFDLRSASQPGPYIPFRTISSNTNLENDLRTAGWKQYGED